MMHRLLLAFTAISVSASFSNLAYSQVDLRIWNEFMSALRSGKMSVDKIRPHTQLGDTYKPILLGYLDSVRTQAAPED